MTAPAHVYLIFSLVRLAISFASLASLRASSSRASRRSSFSEFYSSSFFPCRRSASRIGIARGLTPRSRAARSRSSTGTFPLSSLASHPSEVSSSSVTDIYELPGAVSLSFATEAASVPIDYRLYLPKAWAEDDARRACGRCARGGGIPEEAGDRPRIALANRARLPGAQAGTRAQPLRRAQSARLPSSCEPLHRRLRLPLSAR